MSRELKFLAVAREIAAMSKASKHKIGAVILSPDLVIVSTGYNGCARGVADSAEHYAHPAKRFMIAHAEANAIYQAARTGARTDGCSMLVTGLQPCAQCANAIVQAGIKKVLYPAESAGAGSWVDDFMYATQILHAGGVLVVPY